LAVVAELFLIIYIVYYHTVLVPGLETAQMIFWGFMLLASPLLATIGSQLTYVAFASKIEGLKKQALRMEREQRDAERAESAAPEGEGEEEDED
jgi:hypothetical protein